MWHFLWKCFSYLLISPLLYILGFTLASDQILKTARNWSLLEDSCGFELTNIVFISNSHPNHKCAFDKWFMYCKLYVHLHVYQPKLVKACLWHLNFWELFNLVLRSVFWIFSCMWCLIVFIEEETTFFMITHSVRFIESESKRGVNGNWSK